MATVRDVEAIIETLPEVTEGVRYGFRTWSVGKKHFAWERPFSKADLTRFGDEEPPDGPILAVSVEDLAEKEAVLQAGNPGFFTIPHIDGYAAVLIQLRRSASATCATRSSTAGWPWPRPRWPRTSSASDAGGAELGAGRGAGLGAQL